MSKGEGREQELVDLLKFQIGNYQQAIDLEEKLAKLITNSKFEKIAKNTAAKVAVMTNADQIYSQLLPLIEQCRAEDGALEDEEAEELRQEAIALLEKISPMLEKNLSEITASREKMRDGFKVAKQAKQVVHGYKRTKSIYRSKFDTKS